MPSAQAHPPDGDEGAGGRADDDDRPIILEDVDRALHESAGVGPAGAPDLLRAWRTRLSATLDVLVYARSILADDIGILRHRLVTDAPSSKELVDDLPGVLAARPWGEGWSAPQRLSDRVEVDPLAISRADALLVVHAEMAVVDYTDAEDVRRVLALVEEQMTALATRQDALEVRLQEVRAGILRHYQEGTIPTENWPE